jgi:hypothetical protein
MFAMKVQDIGDFIHAVVNDYVGPSTGGFKNLIYKCPIPSSWFFTPTGSFTFSGETEQEVQMLLECGIGRESPGSHTFTGSPTAANLAKIYKTGKIVRGAFNPGHIPPEGYLGYTLCLRVLNAYSFLSGLFMFPSGTIDAGALAQQTGAGSDELKVIHLGMTSLNGPVLGTCPATSNLAHGATITQWVAPPLNNVEKIKQVFVNPMSSSFRAEPYNIVFPYFEGMNLVDTDVITSTFEDTFLKILGTDASRALDAWRGIKAGLKTLSKFQAGRAMAHAFRGIQFSKQAACGIIFLVANGEYFGFVLRHFETFSFLAFGKKVDAVDHATLLNILGSMNNHEAGLNEIVAFLKTPTQTGTTTPLYNVTKEDIDTSRKLVTILKSIDRTKFTAADAWRDFAKSIEKLTFGDEFGTPTVGKINSFFEYVRTGNEQVLADYPAYIGSRYYEHQDRVAVGLGIFGINAPSLNYATAAEDGKVFTLPRNDSADDANTAAAPDGSRLLRTLPFHYVPINTALGQWNSLFSQGRFKIPKGTVQKKKGVPGRENFTDPSRVDLQVGNAPFFTQFYVAIKSISNTTREALRAGKRPVGDGDEMVETSGRKKQKKIFVDMMEGME